MDIGSLLFIGIGCVFFYFFIYKTKRRYLLKKGIPAFAKVISIEKTEISLGSGVFSRPLMEIMLEVEDTEEEYKQIYVRTTFDFSEVEPKPGDRVDIRIDPKNPYKAIILPRLKMEANNSTPNRN